MEDANGCKTKDTNDTKDTKDTKDIEDEELKSEDEDSKGSSDSKPNESDEEMEEPNHNYKPEQLMEALNNVKNLQPDYVIKFELQHSPLVVIAKTENNDRITFPIYNRIIDGTSNSMQLKSDDFQIVNSSWDEYVEKFIIPKIKFEMVLDFEVKPILKSFHILQSPSEVTSLVQHEFDDNTFASLVIQLPSQLKGGEHRIVPPSRNVYHHERNYDFSSISKGKSEFSPYCIAFHRDLRHEMKAIRNGVGAYLVYDLTVNISDAARVPKTPDIEDWDREMTLRSMLSNWREPGKIIIGLSNNYAKDDLSLDNLKSDDLAFAKQLKKQYAFLTDYGQFEFFLGYLTRTYHGEIVAADTKFNTNDASNILQTEYHIECLRHIDGKEMVNFGYFNVKFDDEVWPANCFDGVKPHRCTRERVKHTDPCDDYEVGLHVAKYYRRPVIVLFTRYNFIDELKKSFADVAEIYKIFITLYEEYERRPVKRYVFRDAARFDIWAWSIACMSIPKNQQNTIDTKELTVNFLKVLIRISENTRDTRPFKHYFECTKRALTEDIIPLLIIQCNKCNWLPFSQILCDMFKETKPFSKAQKYLTYFIDDDSSDTEAVSNKKTVLQSVFNTILNKQKKQFDYDFNKFFRLAWSFAKTGGLDIREYGKKQTIEDIVPFLIKMAEQDAEARSDVIWLDMANHFINIMETRIASNLELNWRRPNVKFTTRCDCIKSLTTFLNDDLQSTTFHLQKIHRNHFQSVISSLSYLKCMSSAESGVGNLFVLKEQKVGQPHMAMFERMNSLVAKLRSFCQP